MEEAQEAAKANNVTFESIAAQVESCLAQRNLAGADNAVLLMVSGGSDSTALAYLADDLHKRGVIGALAMLHVNHKLRGADADEDARFVVDLAELLDIPLFQCEIDIAAEAARTHDNVEAVARRERYLAANEALRSLCQHEAYPLADGRIFTAHSADDRIENFYMRSIVGTGPGGFRSMLYQNGPVVRPVLDLTRETLRQAIEVREREGLPVACDSKGHLWREDATNAHTDRFRAYVRHEIVPKARAWNEAMTSSLIRSMNLIADEDDMLEDMARQLEERCVTWNGESGPWGTDLSEGFLLLPALGNEPVPLARRVVISLLKRLLGADARIEAASVDAVLNGFVDGKPQGGYVVNIQGDLAVSANAAGVRVEPMAYYRARRKRNKDNQASSQSKPQSQKEE